jgi:hypothetical protein
MNVGKLLVGDVAKPIEAVGNVLDKLFTSDEERLTRQEAMAKLAMQPQLAQVELNKIEAAHRSVFVAGWRPFIGWVCGASLAFPFLINPCIQWYTGQPGPDMPTEALISLVMSLLGMSTLRTLEKVRGVSK